MSLTHSQEDYLKIVWHLEQAHNKATVTLVAENLNVKSPTVLSMFRQLQKNQLITYNKNEGARLTPVGEDNARVLVRKHRLIETFLETVLEMDEQHIHDEAEKLEHVISDQLMYRIDAYLGFPDKDPHGSIIPLWKKDTSRKKLNKVLLDESFTVKSINFSKNEKRYYEKSNLVIGSLWTMAEIPPGGECFMISNGKRFLAIPDAIAEKVKVTLRK